LKDAVTKNKQYNHMKEQELADFLKYVIEHYYTKPGSKKLWQGLTISRTTIQVAQSYLRKTNTVVVNIERTKNHYSAYAENAKGVYGAGNTLEEVKEAIKEGIRLIKKHNKGSTLPTILKRKYTIEFRKTKSVVMRAYGRGRGKPLTVRGSSGRHSTGNHKP
jgi:predicted RNase H-like HicB family nuclease